MKALKISTAVLALLYLTAMFFYEKDIPVEELKAKYANSESKFVNIDGMDVHYRIEGQGMPILLIHGTGSMLQTWDGWTEKLKAHYQVIRMELPGFGLTGPRADGNYSTQMYVDFVEKFRKTVGVDSFYLAGNSLGGLIAWKYAAAYPSGVKKLILVDPAGFHEFKDKGGSFIFNMSRDYPGLTSYLVNIGTSYLVGNTLKEVYEDDAKIAPLLQTYCDIARRAGNRKAFIDRAKYAQEKCSDEELKSIHCPTLVQWGNEDLLIDVREAEHFKNIPQTTFKFYEKMGHVPQEEAPEMSVQDVIAFLK